MEPAKGSFLAVMVADLHPTLYPSEIKFPPAGSCRASGNPPRELEKAEQSRQSGIPPSRLLKNLVVSWSGWDSEGIRKDKDESPGVGVKATKPQSCRAKVSGNSLKQIIGPRHPLFWGSNSQQSAH